MADLRKFVGNEAIEALITNIKAEDVKVKEAANAYADSLADNYDAAGAAATAKAEAIADADAKIATVNGNLEKKADQTALQAEVNRATEKENELAGSISSVDARVVANSENIAAINHEETGILAQAKADAKSKADAVQANVDALDEKLGDLPADTDATDVVDYINKKTANIASDETVSALDGRVAGLETDVANIKKDYLVTADKTELEGKITTAQEAAEAAQGEVDALEQTHATDKAALEGSIALKADKTALDELSEAAATKVALKAEEDRAKGEEARIEGLVTAEAERAAGVEADHEERIEKMEVFWDTTEDADGVVNKLKEIQEYIASDESGAAAMAGSIQENSQAIADHVATDHDFAAADTALKDELTEEINKKAAQADLDTLAGRVTTEEGKTATLEGKVETLEGEMDAVQGAVATKVEQEAYNTKVAELEGEDTAIKGRLDDIEAQLGDGEGSVTDMIADAKTEVLETATADATSKANQALEDAKKYADEEDAKIEARVDALETDTHTHANKAELDKIAEGDKANWDDAVSKAHIHDNKAELDKVVEGDVAKWNAAEQNAKDYAKGLVDATDANVSALKERVTTVEGAVATKAEAATVTALAERVTTNEANIAANTSAINAFVGYTAAEINAYFA